MRYTVRNGMYVVDTAANYGFYWATGNYTTTLTYEADGIYSFWYKGREYTIEVKIA